MVDIPFIPPDATVVDMPVAEVDPVASNESAQVDGRVYLFVLDDDHTESGDTLRVRQLMHQFISEWLSANDLAAIVMTSGVRAQNFTRNRRLLRDAVDRFIGDRGVAAGGTGILQGQAQGARILRAWRSRPTERLL
jgi:hypothetical protein